ncbi:hypothetical protein F8388_018170 [Cannabis sativa]|uniref:Uncharacterized protein n=1 Tax=Cannabis sativa TaxID=3483 RepID=A0A7J6GAS4_CANSA|nr:hypothetical protein F8388_018170 [Cannabis sativa]
MSLLEFWEEEVAFCSLSLCRLQVGVVYKNQQQHGCCGCGSNVDWLQSREFDPNVKPYGEWMKAVTRKKNYLIGAQWLRSGHEEDDGGITGSGQPRSMAEMRESIDPTMARFDGDNSGSKSRRK